MVGRTFRDLVAWQKGMDLVVAVYQVTRSWPSDETFGLTSQVRRCAVSVVANIAEGQGRTGSREFLHLLSLAHGSLAELETHLLIAYRVQYIDGETIEPLIEQLEEVRRLIRGLIKSLRPATR